MKKKINVAILFGGKSVEHEISLQSARNVIQALNRDKYTVVLIGIDKEGKWHHFEESTYLMHAEDPKKITLGCKQRELELLQAMKIKPIDVVFPILHGQYGEDGTVQGLLELANVPYVGASVLGSAIGMDKNVTKRLIRDAGIPVADFLTMKKHQKHLWPFEKIEKLLGLPLFVKPVNSGSSIGMSKVHSLMELEEAIEFAFQFDQKILIEKAIEGIEIQCGIIGNEYPIVSLPCQIIPKGEFHSYSSKYLDFDGAEFIIPAKLSNEELSAVQMVSLQAYQILCCEGMSRVDLFMTKTGEVFFNEINTIPGLTNNSPYSKMWQASGLMYADMLDQLIQFAFDRHQKKQRLVTHIEVEKQECIKI